MNDIKLVVISPFKGYTQGSVIDDPAIINSILDKKNSMHSFSHLCRRVSKKLIERQQYIPPSQPDEPSKQNEKTVIDEPQVEPSPLPPQDAPEVEADMELKNSDDEGESLLISSITVDASEMAARPAKTQRRKR